LTSIKLKAFQALNGDCMLLSYYNNKEDRTCNILIDAGYALTYHRTLKTAVQEVINNAGRLDLIIVSHHDIDHIGGFIPLFKEFGTDHIESVWLNYSADNFTFPPESGAIGIRQGILVRDYLLSSSKLNNQAIFSGQNHTVQQAKFQILSPSLHDLDLYNSRWAELEHNQPYAPTRISARPTDHHEPIDDLIKKTFVADNSLSNKTSISSLITINNRKIMLTSDACPTVLADSLHTLGYSEEQPVNLSLMQVSHHGSKGNTNETLLKMLDCRHYLVSTNSANSHGFPHKQTLARITRAAFARNPQEPIYFYFTYNELGLKKLFTEEEIFKYNIICQYPEPNDNGILITIR
jgi:beta-lactamase superfamily II metal-dependent hydrolase